MLRGKLFFTLSIAILCSCGSLQFTNTNQIPLQKIEFSKQLSIRNMQYVEKIFSINAKSYNILKIEIEDFPKNFSYSSDSVKPTQTLLKIEATATLQNQNNNSQESFTVFSQRTIPISQFNPIANNQLERDYQDLMHREILDKIYLQLASK